MFSAGFYYILQFSIESLIKVDELSFCSTNSAIVRQHIYLNGTYIHIHAEFGCNAALIYS